MVFNDVSCFFFFVCGQVPYLCLLVADTGSPRAPIKDVVKVLRSSFCTDRLKGSCPSSHCLTFAGFPNKTNVRGFPSKSIDMGFPIKTIDKHKSKDTRSSKINVLMDPGLNTLCTCVNVYSLKCPLA